VAFIFSGPTNFIFPHFQHQLLMKLAVVGGGPSALYVTSRLFSLLKHDPNIRVHVYDRLWSPYGLVRYGVAPDHPEVKVWFHSLCIFLSSHFCPRTRELLFFKSRIVLINLIKLRKILDFDSLATLTSFRLPLPLPSRQEPLLASVIP